MDPTLRPTIERAPTAFAVGIARRRSPATWVLLAMNVTMYLYELYNGAPDYSPALIRMGALMRERVLAGEVWRLVTCTFLHASWLHLGFNMMVLFGLGTMLERILGTWRFLLLYGLSALGGSVGSLIFTHGLSVGASGALWGLMTAQFVLALRSGGILPEPLRVRMRAGAMQNLMLNIVNSMLPGVDWAAHAGGGTVGAILGAVGLLTWGLPRWAAFGPGEDAGPDRVPALVVLGSLATSGLLVLGLVAGVVLGRVDVLSAAPTLSPRHVATSGWTVDVPAALTTSEGTGDDVAFGDLETDPVVVEVVVSSFDPLADEADLAPLPSQLATQMAQAENGFSILGGVQNTVVDGVTVLDGDYLGPNGYKLHRALAIRPYGVARVDVLYGAGAPGTWTGIGRTVALSARRTP